MTTLKWQGTYSDYLASERWKQLARYVKSQFNDRCALCGVSDSLHVHHNSYERVGCELDGDLICLCASCHAKHHNRKLSEHQGTELWFLLTLLKHRGVVPEVSRVFPAEELSVPQYREIYTDLIRASTDNRAKQSALTDELLDLTANEIDEFLKVLDRLDRVGLLACAPEQLAERMTKRLRGGAA